MTAPLQYYILRRRGSGSSSGGGGFMPPPQPGDDGDGDLLWGMSSLAITFGTNNLNLAWGS